VITGTCRSVEHSRARAKVVYSFFKELIFSSAVSHTRRIGRPSGILECLKHDEPNVTPKKAFDITS
jgi:hypothetical protein